MHCECSQATAEALWMFTGNCWCIANVRMQLLMHCECSHATADALWMFTHNCWCTVNIHTQLLMHCECSHTTADALQMFTCNCWCTVNVHMQLWMFACNCWCTVNVHRQLLMLSYTVSLSSSVFFFSFFSFLLFLLHFTSWLTEFALPGYGYNGQKTHNYSVLLSNVMFSVFNFSWCNGEQLSISPRHLKNFFCSSSISSCPRMRRMHVTGRVDCFRYVCAIQTHRQSTLCFTIYMCVPYRLIDKVFCVLQYMYTYVRVSYCVLFYWYLLCSR